MESRDTVWRPSPTVCRCCFNDGCYKDISTEYFWMGKREVYSEMLTETLDVSISYSQSGGPNSNSRLICEPCIARLRDASEFKKQVLECEKMFLQQLDPDKLSTPAEVEVQTFESQLKTEEEVKIEKRISIEEDFTDNVEFGTHVDDIGHDDDDDDDLDDQPLTKLASKIPKKEKVDLMDLVDNVKATEKRKSSSKVKSNPAKRAKTKTKLKIKSDAAQPSPTPSGSKVVIKKQKVEDDDEVTSRENCKMILLNSTAYPFRIKSCKYLCIYCFKSFEDPDEFRNHSDQEHPTLNVNIALGLLHSSTYIRVDVTNLKCRICEEPFPKLDNLVQHLNGTHGLLDLNTNLKVIPYRLEKEKWNCEICNEKQRGLMQLMAHTNSHYQALVCDNCGRKFLSQAGLRKHVKCKHASHPYVCRSCYKGFDTYEAKYDHVRKVKDCHPFSCNKCKDRFMYYEARQRHMASEHGEPMKTYKCNECDNVYQSRTLLYLHHKVHHSNKHFSCQTCGAKLPTNSELNRHTLIHSGIKNFHCDICGKSFSRKTGLNCHYRIHDPVKAYVCTVCNKGFTQSAKLKYHVKTHCLDSMD